MTKKQPSHTASRGKQLVFSIYMTNGFDLPAAAIAALNRPCRQIELVLQIHQGQTAPVD